MFRQSTWFSGSDDVTGWHWLDWSIQTLLSGENDLKQADEIQAIVVLEFDDSCYVDARQYHLASFSTRNSTLNTSLR